MNLYNEGCWLVKATSGPPDFSLLPDLPSVQARTTFSSTTFSLCCTIHHWIWPNFLKTAKNNENVGKDYAKKKRGRPVGCPTDLPRIWPNLASGYQLRIWPNFWFSPTDLTLKNQNESDLTLLLVTIHESDLTFGKKKNHAKKKRGRPVGCPTDLPRTLLKVQIHRAPGVSLNRS